MMVSIRKWLVVFSLVLTFCLVMATNAFTWGGCGGGGSLGNFETPPMTNAKITVYTKEALDAEIAASKAIDVHLATLQYVVIAVLLVDTTAAAVGAATGVVGMVSGVPGSAQFTEVWGTHAIIQYSKLVSEVKDVFQ